MNQTNPSAFSGRIPPHDIEAERALLGSMLLESEVADEAIGALKAEDFYRPAHRTIFEAMHSIVSQNIGLDHLSLADRLKSMQKLDAVGGQPYLLELSGAVPTTLFWENYAEIVSRLSVYRKLISAGSRVAALAYETPENLTETVAQSEQILFSVTGQEIKNDFTPLTDQLVPTFARLEELAAMRGKIVGVPTGFSKLDRMTSGFRSGELIILAARPAVGKTSLALNMMVGAAKNGVKVAFFSLEMGVEDLTQRILCSEAEVNLQDIRAGRVKDDEWSKIAEGMGSLSGLDILIDDTPSLNITELRAKATRHFKGVDGKEKKGLIIVDYLQLMQPARRNTENRQVEIAEISRGLKILAKTLNVPIIALSQLSRAVESRAGKRPQLSDLRESGAIEQDADIVMFLDRNTDPTAEGEEGRPERGTAELIIAKHRNGPTGVVHLAFIDRYTKFRTATFERQ